MYEMSLFVCIGQESYFRIPKSPGILLVKMLSAEVSIYPQQLQVNIGSFKDDTSSLSWVKSYLPNRDEAKVLQTACGDVRKTRTAAANNNK